MMKSEIRMKYIGDSKLSSKLIEYSRIQKAIKLGCSDFKCERTRNHEKYCRCNMCLSCIHEELCCKRQEYEFYNLICLGNGTIYGEEK